MPAIVPPAHPRRFLVTGATGFIGRHVALRLHARGDVVLASGRDPTALQALASTGLHTHRSDLAVDPLAALVEGTDAVVHCAALSSPWGPRDAFITANVDATRRLLQAALKAGTKRFVHMSSPSIYFAMRDRYDIGESFVPPKRWITAYAESKWLAELEVHAHADTGDAIQAVILRPRAVFGPGDRAIFPRIVARASSGVFPLVGGGQAVIDVTHVDNVVHAVERALDADLGTAVATFNISNDQPMPVRTLLDTLFNALDMPVRYRQVSRPAAMGMASLIEGLARLRPGQPEPAFTRYTLGVLAYTQTLDIRAARSQLGYQPGIDVREGIAAFARDWNGHASD